MYPTKAVKIRMALSFLASALVMSACSSPVGLQLSTDRGTYRKGDTVTLTLSNGTSERIGYNLCPTSLEEESEGWAAIEETRVCTMELRSMPPGEKESTIRELPSDIEPGIYRLSLSVNPGEDEQRVISNEFRVR